MCKISEEFGNIWRTICDGFLKTVKEDALTECAPNTVNIDMIDTYMEEFVNNSVFPYGKRKYTKVNRTEC